MIENIATDVSNKLINSALSSDFDGFVGMQAHMKKMEPILHLESNEVRMIGIWGPSGIGKSTIARFLFGRHSGEFQLSVFMENIKRPYPRPYYDEYIAKLQLQKDFLSQIINHDDIRIHHLGVAQDRLKDKKVLVVLDDIDHLAQLDAIAKDTRWFGSGSRIIITTQDKRILNAHGINHIYEVDFPFDNEAVQMFCMYAFGQNFPRDGFEELAWEVTELAGRLPLGLRVMGSYFKGMLKNEWIKALPRLRISLDGEIESILKFSYDALCGEDKDLFLYIACFFNNEEIEKVEEYLAKNFVDVRQSLHVIAEKSLISFSSERIYMHDLLARLGKEIVRKQSIHEPGQRQFLFDTRDICQVLNDDTFGSRSVITCIDFKYTEIEDEIHISEGAFERMLNLQFLRVCSDDNIIKYAVKPRIINLPRKVRLLDWEYFPLTSLPCNFNPEFLVKLNMPNSKLEKLWEGIQTIKNLKWMNLSYSKNLKELPDLSTATNLKEVNLCGCSSLVELPSSIGNLINLSTLNLRDCSSLVELPSSIGNFTILQRLDLRDCTSLVKLPSSFGNLTNLNLMEIDYEYFDSFFLGSHFELDFKLEFDGCSSLVKLPSSIGNLTNFKILQLRNCSSLQELPSSIGNLIYLHRLNLCGCSSLVELPSSIGNLIKIENLDLTDCSSLVNIPSSIGNLQNLQRLSIEGCSKLESIPIDINMESIGILNLDGCSSLKNFPQISTNISYLSLIGTAIEEVPSSIRSCSRLRKLDMSYSKNLEKSPHAFDYITELHVSDTRIQEIAPWVKELSRLESLVVMGCTELVSLPQLPESLAFLDAENCESLERLDCSFHNTKFICLNFVNCFKLNQEARDLIIKKLNFSKTILPGEKVPSYFTYQANGSSLSMKLNGFDTHLPTSLNFKVCILPVNKGAVKVDDQRMKVLYYRITEKQDGVSVSCRSKYIFLQGPLVMKHLYIFEFDEEVSSSELVFEFEFKFPFESWEIGECGIRTSFV